MLRQLRLIPILLAAMSLLASEAPAQSGTDGSIILDGVEEMDFDRPESWALKYFANVSMLGGFGTPRPSAPGAVDLEFELGWIPSLSEEQRRVGFVGNKVEDLNRNDLFARLRVRFGLPRDFSILVGLTPPVERNGVTPTLIVLAVERPILESSGWRLGLRGYGQLGSIEGDFICPAVVSGRDDLEINPDQCHKASKDEVGLDYLGLELSASRRLGNERWEPYLSISANYLDLDFQIDARYSVFEDRNRLATSGVTYAARLGLEFAAADRLEISGELFFSPLQIQRQPMGETEYDNLLNLRLLVGYGLF